MTSSNWTELNEAGHDETTAIPAKSSYERCLTHSNAREADLEQKVLHATSTFISHLLPFTPALPVSLSQDIDTLLPSHSIPLSPSHKSYSHYHEAGVDVDLCTPPDPPRRKGSWVSRSNGTERRQSCRRVNSRRDWSGELEESDYRLPFPVSIEETERGGRRMVSFRDEIVLPRIDTSFIGQGLMIDMEQIGASTLEETGEGEDIEGSAVGTESSFSSGIESLETDMSTDSEWTASFEEAEGIEMLF